MSLSDGREQTNYPQKSRGVREDRGVIVNVSSMFGIGGPPGPFSIAHYTAAKHGMSSLLVSKVYTDINSRVGHLRRWYDYVDNHQGPGFKHL